MLENQVSNDAPTYQQLLQGLMRAGIQGHLKVHTVPIPDGKWQGLPVVGVNVTLLYSRAFPTLRLHSPKLQPQPLT